MDKAASSFIPAFSGSPHGWQRVGWPSILLVEGCLCGSTILYAAINQMTEIDKGGRGEPKHLITDLGNLDILVHGQLSKWILDSQEGTIIRIVYPHRIALRYINFVVM